MRTVRSLSVISVLLITLLEGALVYVGRAHFAYTPADRVVPLLLILGVSLLVTALFGIRVVLAPPPVPVSGWRRFFLPAYLAIRETLRERSYACIALVATFAYALLFLVASGAVSHDAIGPRLQVLWTGVPGYVPQFIVFPTWNLGIVVSAYQAGAVLSLAVLFAANIALLLRLYALQGKLSFGSRSLLPALGGGAGGLFVSCAACATPPVVALISLVVPAAAFLQQTAGTALVYFVSVFLVFVGLSYLSRSVESGLICPADG